MHVEQPRRDITTFRCSTAISRPATNVQIGLPKSSCAIAATITATRVPATASANRQPNAFIPNALMPSAITHLPSGGCTHEPTSHLCSRQYFSSLDRTWHVRSDHPM